MTRPCPATRVLVEMDSHVGGKRRDVVSPALLRGPYERGAAEVAEFVRKRDERRHASEAAVDAAKRAAQRRT